ncbi:MAG TPA: hypothetical protein PLO90_06510 [Clostridia bacterium]|nr:hypothetical protein [Clostridia bacterium]HPY43998.1 hypothetical protein [Clostridia bacterium]HQA98024.1 hypothetical protein [Clostridia bacterium]HQO56277.1 hypothetical protein [Clostridia bacterium]HUM61556.1 hypothetical protein [Clostridia bacterium]
MKTKHWGLLLLVLVIVVAGVYSWFQGREAQQVEITGYIGGEKIGLVDDPEVKKILLKEKKLTLNYQKAGSLDMIRLDHTGRDYLWPSSQTALDLYEKTFGKPPKSEIVFNTPIVLYTRRIVADALTKAGYVTQQDGVHFLDMKTFLPVLEKGERWESLGLPLYGSVLVSTTNPTKSNSGNMFAGLLANMINDGNVVTLESVDAVIPRLKALIERLGYMETSSADIFSQFLKTGVGARPLVAGYESQLLEFAHTNPEDYRQIKDDVVLLYPVPTVWSSHVYIALSEKGKLGLEALLAPGIQALAWEKHGFRTGINAANMDVSNITVPGIAPVISKIIQMPDSQVMEKLIQSLEH